MKKLALSFLIISCILWQSCRKLTCDCIDPTDQTFKILDKRTGENLTFNNNSGPLEIEAVSLFLMVDGQRSYERFTPVLGLDSTFSLSLDAKKSDRYFADVGPGEVDTIDLIKHITSGECCDGLHIIDSIRWNNKTVRPINGAYTIVR